MKLYNNFSQLPQTTKNLTDNTTPFMDMDLGGRWWVRLYWTKGGVYGPQVSGIVLDSIGDKWGHYKTNGCGFSKTNDCLHHILKSIEVSVDKLHDNNQFSDAFNYRVGGNFYKVLIKDVNFKKRS